MKGTLQPIEESTQSTLFETSVNPASCYIYVTIRKIATFDPWSTEENKLIKCHVTS